jgi:hypothetical protein
MHHVGMPRSGVTCSQKVELPWSTKRGMTIYCMQRCTITSLTSTSHHPGTRPPIVSHHLDPIFQSQNNLSRPDFSS